MEAVPRQKGHKDCKLCGKHFDRDGKEITDLTIAVNDDHDWNAWESNRDGTHTRTCKRRLSHTERVACSGGTATCTQAAVCVVCKGTYGNTSAHAYGALVDEKRSTCQKEGVKAHYKCSVCEKYFDEDKAETTFGVTTAAQPERTRVWRLAR